MSGHRLRSPVDRLIVAGIALVMGLALLTIYVAWEFIETRADEQVEQELEDQQRNAAARVDSWTEEWGDILRVEVSYILRHDSLRPLQFADRCETLMDSYWPILSVHLADERGNEVAVLQQDSSRLLRETFRDSINMTRLTRLDAVADTLVPRSWPDTVVHDPRAYEWFGHALGNERVDPVWGTSASNDLLQLSQLIRPLSDSAAFRVLAFVIDPERVGSGLLGRAVGSTTHAFLVLPSGTVLSTGARSAQSPDTIAQKAVATWATKPTDAAFDIGTAPRYRCRIIVHSINGASVHLGTMVDLAMRNGLMERARWLTGAGLAVILLLITLLLFAYVRKRQDLLRLHAEQAHAREQQARLEKAIGERDVLDRETHHRVKNNLQVVSSLLNIQAQRIEEGLVKEEFLRGKARIDTMALVHHKLYGLPDLRGVDLHTFFQELIRAVRAANEPESHAVSCEVRTHDLKAYTDPAIDLGIILCELVNNCYQHAFPYATGGHIVVEVAHLERDKYRMSVTDNGVGMGPGNPRAKARLGLEIVDALAGQLDGSFTVRSQAGTSCELLFRMDAVEMEA